MTRMARLQVQTARRRQVLRHRAARRINSHRPQRPPSPRKLCIVEATPVSYTHLTLPTKA